jgi:hypothetical protein
MIAPDRHATPRKAYIGWRACDVYTVTRYGKTTRRSRRTFEDTIIGEKM